MQTTQKSRDQEKSRSQEKAPLAGKANTQLAYFLRYLSLAPVLAILAVSIAVTIWILINAYIPDRLFYPE